MTSSIKIIKYCAIAFAALLIVGIISGAIFLINTIFDIKNDNNEKLSNFSLDANISKKIEIDLMSTNLIINESEEFNIQTNNKYIEVKNVNGNLSIEEKKHSIINNTNYEIVINIPVNYLFNDVEIDGGAGSITIENINSSELSLDLGAGKVSINNLNISHSVDIDGGAGEITIINSHLNNLDLDMGVGKCTINSYLVGKTDIDAGVGELNLNIKGTLNDHTIKVNKGLGDFTINNEKVVDDKVYGTGTNNIYVNGGIGKINITTN